jgi:hypothetical protein
MRFPEVGGDMQGKLDSREDKGQMHRRAKRWINGANDRGSGGRSGSRHRAFSGRLDIDFLCFLLRR